MGCPRFGKSGDGRERANASGGAPLAIFPTAPALRARTRLWARSPGSARTAGRTRRDTVEGPGPRESSRS